MQIQLNVALARNDGAPDNSVLDVVSLLTQSGFKISKAEYRYIEQGGHTLASFLVATVKPPKDMVPQLLAMLPLLAIDAIQVGYVKRGVRLVHEVSLDMMHGADEFFWLT